MDMNLGSWFEPSCDLVFTPYEGEPLPLDIGEDPDIDWSLGIADLVAAIQEERPAKLSTARSVHLVEVLDAAKLSSETGGPVALGSTF